MKEQEKLTRLIEGFTKLDENGRESIGDLIKKLVSIQAIEPGIPEWQALCIKQKDRLAVVD